MSQGNLFWELLHGVIYKNLQRGGFISTHLRGIVLVVENVVMRLGIGDRILVLLLLLLLLERLFGITV